MTSQSTPHDPTPAPSGSPFSDAHAAWHAGVEAARTAPYGPLSPTALHVLAAEPQALPGLPGTWRADADGLVTVELAAEDGVERGGEPVSGAVELGPLTGLDSTALAWGEIQIDVAARSGLIVVRPRDPNAPARLGYAGTRTFAPCPEWAVEARFVPAERDDVAVPSALGADRLQHYASPGRAEFAIGGRDLALTLFGSAERGDLRAIFADETGADLTFPAARFVGVRETAPGELVIDFNRATNPPCAYSESATCPFPPPENRLPIRIEAGELRPGVERPAA